MLKTSQLIGFGFGGGFGNDRHTVSLLHMDGADAATTFADVGAGAVPHAWTANGNAQVDTAQSKFGGASLLLDGTGDDISTPNHADFIFAGDYTLEAWIRPNSIGANQGVIGKGNVTGFSPWLVYLANGGTMQFYSSSNGTTWDIVNALGFGTVSTGTWYHVAVVRSGNNYFAFQNGSLNNTASSSGVPISAADAVRVGSQNGTTTFNGWIDEVRISRTARWTAAFTPPVGPYS